MKINNSVEFEFYKNYAENVAPILEEFENQRKKSFALFILMEVCLIVFAAIIHNSVKMTSENEMLFYIVFSISFIAIAYFINKLFCQELKMNCMPMLINTFENITWQLHKGPTDYVLGNSELFSEYNTKFVDDCFFGKYKDVDFCIYETLLTCGGVGFGTIGFMRYTVFKGVIVSFSLNKRVNNKTIVTTKGDINVRNNHPLGRLLIILLFIPLFWSFYIDWDTLLEHIQFVAAIITLMIIIIIWTFEISNPVTRLLFRFKYQWRERVHKITLEDPEFNKKYEACSSDEVEGRYLLTTAFMERFKNLHTVFGSRKAKCSFYNGNKIMFAIPTYKNLFEIGNLFFPINNIKKINTFLKEIQAVYDLIEYFKLDQRIGL